MLAEIILAAGCFWCIEADMEKAEGVVDVVSGYSGGELENPSYKNHEGHREVVKVTYDPERISDEDLLRYFYRHTDYEDNGGAFCDRGFAYSPAVYYATESQKEAAGNVAPASSVVPILAAKTFWTAEDYHQDYAHKNPLRYKYYRSSCGRDKRVKALNEQWRNKQFESKIEQLEPLASKVLLHEGTERRFTHPYADYTDEEHRGIYVDVLSGQPLYTTLDQYHSGSGWPSFHQPISGGVLKYTPETWSRAIELKSTGSYSHLGHIILDNPHRKDQWRHCINGVSLRHIPYAELEAQGYGQYKSLWDKPRAVISADKGR